MLPFAGVDTSTVLLDAMKTAELNHTILANNIANVDTPGYKRIEVTFEEDLKKAVRDLKPFPRQGNEVDTYPRLSRIENFSPRARMDDSLPARADESNVSIDREMADLSKNRGKILALTELLSRSYSDLKAAIRGRNV